MADGGDCGSASYSSGDCGGGDSGGCSTSHTAGDGGSYSGGDSGIDDIPQGGSSSSSRPLTAEEKAARDRRFKEEQEEYERGRAERKEKKQQRRAVRAETAIAVKAKRHEVAKLKEKIRLTATLLTLKLHL